MSKSETRKSSIWDELGNPWNIAASSTALLIYKFAQDDSWLAAIFEACLLALLVRSARRGAEDPP